MKFKDPKTGELFDSISAARRAFCNELNSPCVQCPIAGDEMNCFAVTSRNPTEAARLMGYEIMDEEGKMEKEDKPRLAEVLGVDVDQWFSVNGHEYCVNQYGNLVNRYGVVYSDVLTDAINYPESIIRTPRLTEPEIAIMRAVGAKWVSLDDTESIEYVYLWDYKPIFSDTNCEFGWDNGRPSVAQVLKSLFPSVEPGDCLSIDGGGADGD